MSKAIIDAVMHFNSRTEIFGLIPTRRQIDYNSGYVNNWSTSQLSSYVDGKVTLLRDHAGPNQGMNEDDWSSRKSKTTLSRNSEIHGNPVEHLFTTRVRV